MSVHNELLRQVRSILGIQADWVKERPGGFTWWPAGIRQDIGCFHTADSDERKLDQSDQSCVPSSARAIPRCLVTTCLGVDGRELFDLVGPMRDAVLAAVTTVGPQPGVAVFASAFTHGGSIGGDIEKTAQTIAIAAAAQLKVRLSYRGRGDDSTNATIPVPQSAVDAVLSLVSPDHNIGQVPTDELTQLRSDLGHRGLKVSVDGRVTIAEGAIKDCPLPGQYKFSIDSAANHRLFGAGVRFDVEFPKLVSAAPPVVTSAALAYFAWVAPDEPDVWGLWSPGNRFRYTTFIPADLVTKPGELRHLSSAVLRQVNFFVDLLFYSEQNDERFWDLYRRFTPSNEDEIPRVPCDAVVTEDVRQSEAVLPDDAEHVADVFLTSRGHIEFTRKYLLAREEGDSEWVLWIRDYIDDLFIPIGLDPIDQPVISCKADGLDARTAAEALLRSAWDRYGICEPGDRLCSTDHPCRGGHLLPIGVVTRLYEEWKARRAAA